MKRLVTISLLTLLLSSIALAQTVNTKPAAVNLDGTTWEGTVKAPEATGELHDYTYQFQFLPGNKLHWKWSDTVYTNATWQQSGLSVRLVFNDGYSTWLGTIDGTRMSGNSTNRLGHKWSWVLTRKAYSAYGDPAGHFAQDAPQWSRFSSEEGRFSILMPGRPKVQEQPVDTDGGQLINHVFLVQSEAAAFAISYADYPQNNADPQKVLDDVRQGAITGIKGTLISGKNITHKGFHGREFQASTQGALYTSRIFIVNNRLYQMVVVAPVGKLSAADINKFLTSFDLKID
jgi:hypothetical protein